MSIKLIRSIIVTLLVLIAGGASYIYWQDKRAVAGVNTTVPSISTSPLSELNINSNDQPKTATLVQIAGQQHTFSQIKQAAEDAIGERTDKINQLKTEVDNSKHLSKQQKQQLGDELNNALEGLKALKNNIIDAQTDDGAFRNLISDITSRYPIYSMLMPKVQGIDAVASDKAVLSNGQQSAQVLDQLVQTLKSQKKDTSQLAKYISEYKKHLDTLSGLLDDTQANFEKVDYQHATTTQTYRDQGVSDLAKINSEFKAADDLLTQQITPLAKKLTS